MLNSIIDAIALKLSEEFGTEIPVYSEPVEQIENKPCFFVYLQTSNRKKMLGERYFMEQKFVIHYYPGTANKNSEILDTIERLNNALEYIVAEGDSLRGTKMNHEIVDNILNFFVNYNFYSYKQAEPKDKMENLMVEAGLKKE